MPARGPNRIYWACVAGLILWAILRAIGVDPHAPPLRLRPFLGILALASLNLGVRTWCALYRDRRRLAQRIYANLGWLFVSIDLLCIAAGLRFSGGLQSAIWVIAFVVLSGETLLESRREATITRSGACLALFLGTVPTPPEVIDGPAYALEMFVRMGLLIAVSSVVRRLRERSEQAKTEVANLRGELALADQRAALAREIHDGVGNSLAASVLRLETEARIREKAAPDDPAVSLLREEARALRETMQQVRDWTFYNRPWSSDVALTTEVARLSHRTGLPITVTGAELLDELPDPIRLAILRVVQEGLTNAAKHATEATHAEASVTQQGNILTLTIHDDGPGFDPNTLTSGVGLASMQERAAGLGGELRIKSAVGQGTTLTLRLPRP